MRNNLYWKTMDIANKLYSPSSSSITTVIVLGHPLTIPIPLVGLKMTQMKDSVHSGNESFTIAISAVLETV